MKHHTYAYIDLNYTERFTQEDTYTGQSNDPLSLNRYLYSLGNPVMFVDPSGYRPANAFDRFSSYDGHKSYHVLDHTIKRNFNEMDKIHLLESRFYEGDGQNEQGILETTLEYAGTLASNPLETVTATGGVVLGGVGFVGSGVIEYVTAGTGSWLAIPAATFSANTALSSAVDLKFIATGKTDKIGSFNLVKDGSEGLFWAAGEGVEMSYEYFSSEDVEIGDYTKYGGTVLYYTSSLAFETKNVSKGFGTMMDESYHLSKSYNTFGNMTGTVNNVSNAEKAGAFTEVIHQMKTWWDTFSAK